MSAALEYHRATDYAPGDWEDEEAERYVGERPPLFKEHGAPERLPLETSVAGPLLQDGAGIVRSQPGRDYGGGTMHWRAYSSAGALYPIEAYVASADGLFSFDPLGRSLIRLGRGDFRPALADAVVADELARAGAIVVLTGIHARTGWKYLERGYRHIWWDAGTMLANLLALAAAEGLSPRLYTSFVDAEVNRVLGVDGVHEYAVAVLALGRAGRRVGPQPSAVADQTVVSRAGRRFPRAERLQEASSLRSAEAVRAWRTDGGEDEPTLARDELVRAIRRRASMRRYGVGPLPRAPLVELLGWSDAAIPADAPRVVRQLVAAAAVEGVAPGIYDASLALIGPREERDLRRRAGFAAMDQDHPSLAAVNAFQLADLDAVVDRLGDRGYRCAQLEAGIRAGRLQIGAVMRGWGAAASTFFDAEVSDLLGTQESPMLMVAVGRRPHR